MAASGVDGPHLLAALASLRQLREELAGWEPTLMRAARDRGLTWAEIAPALGLASRQAAERRYLRLNPRAGETPASTREQRVQATRHQRAGDRAVADWARNNAADLRQLAGQITALTTLKPATKNKIKPIRAALGSNDAADLIGPLSRAGPALRPTHPQLADQIADLDHTSARIRSADGGRGTTAQPTDE
ncbi:hypothetical protein ABN028_32905 [Actinopolymorpha sp. B17G11]|uniref:hypothetical protein n=1 Tax=Actinopolymorpha sp. B17G11 TaxID=3160861 RepID=UPI0032E519A6